MSSESPANRHPDFLAITAKDAKRIRWAYIIAAISIFLSITFSFSAGIVISINISCIVITFILSRVKPLETEAITVEGERFPVVKVTGVPEAD
ncbi:MAG: hypothetical protein E1N59_1882 [Puniceicoccaceae bacterium 5H]|nr:MAG: hypothetical protein E1N59_1882 [Puniceicoccaceae bacterium 5H]